MNTFNGIAWSLLIMVSALWGCSSKQTSSHPPTWPVTGVVTMEGKPIANAIVNFQSADGKRSAIGETNLQGKYELSTFSGSDGAISGEYCVTIVKYSTPSEESAAPAQDDIPFESTFVSTNLLPARYEKVHSSGLMATVVPGKRKNMIDFALTKSP